MPVFQYEALDAKGQEASGKIEALCDTEAASKIRHKGLYPTRVRPVKAAKKTVVHKFATQKERRCDGTGKVKLKRVTQFARQMSTLQDAGLTILRSLRILERQQKNGRFKRIIGYVADDIESGATLSEAMRKHPNCFSRLFVNMVAAGETGGVLDVILVRVAEFLEKSQRLKSRAKGAMVYPSVVLAAAFLIVMGLMTFVIPVFSNVIVDLSDGQRKLPALTQALLNMSEWFKGNYGLNAVVVVFVPLLLILSLKVICRFRPGRYSMDWLKLHIPIIRGIVYRTSVARWTRTLATLINAGVPLLDSLKIAQETAENQVYSAMLNRAHQSIRQGNTLAYPLGQSNAVDELVVNMVEVGEETGDLDKMLLKIAGNFDEEADVMIGSLMSLLEPIMIIVLGLIVGTIVLAIFLPMVGMFPGLMP